MFLKAAAILSGLLSLAAGAVAPAIAQDGEYETPAPVAPEQAPNIVIIFADDMAYGDMSANEAGAWVETPNLDAMAASGMRFTDGYAANAVCGPSRVGLLAGAFPARLGVWWNPDTTKQEIDQPLLPQFVRSRGYDTVMLGKWNLANDVSSAVDTAILPMTWGAVYHPREDGAYEGAGFGWGAGGHPSGKWVDPATDGEYLTDRLTRGAVQYIDGHGGEKPFFMYLAYNAPHSPLEAPARFRDQVAHLENEPQRLYAAMVLSVDEGVGKVREALRRKGIDRDTLVLFISDNGPAESDFAGYRDDWPAQVLGSVGPFSGTKRTLREGGIREPFVVSWPGHIAAGAVNSTAVTTVDIYRTIEDLLGQKTPYTAISDGNSFLPVLTGEADTLKSRDLIWQKRVCNKSGCKDSAAMRHGVFKLLIEDDGAPQFFKLDDDPGETTDVQEQHANRFRNMSERYAAWKAALPEPASQAKGKGRKRDTADMEESE